jgi:hypothetical protein
MEMCGGHVRHVTKRAAERPKKVKKTEKNPKKSQK